MNCPYCGSEHIRKKGKRNNKQRYRCMDEKHPKTLSRWFNEDTIIGVGNDGLFEENARALNKKGNRAYLITSAQNATPVNQGFLSALENFAENNRLPTDILVTAYRYHNTNSPWAGSLRESDWWDSRVHPYLVQSDINLNNQLALLGAAKITPTNQNPLSSLHSVTKGRSGIIGHPQVSLETVPTPQHKLPKIMATTGSITVRNYSDSKAGYIGQFHHQMAGLYVECSANKFFIYQIHWDGKGFYIWDKYVTADSIEEGKASALVLGDEHAIQIDPKVVEATFTNEDALAKVLKPDYLVRHDILDFRSRNHHDRSDFFKEYDKHLSGVDNVEAEVNHCLNYLDETSGDWTNVIVKSNHDEAFDRWLKEVEPRRDVKNAKFYYQTMAGLLEEEMYDPFKYWASKRMKNYDRARFLERDEPFLVSGVALDFHGDVASNGARGSVKAFDKIGVKTVTGHGHSPSIFRGATRVGISSVYNMGYNLGPSSWAQCHAAVWPNGHTCLFFIVDGKWRI